MLYSTSLSQVSTRQIRSYVVFYVPVTSLHSADQKLCCILRPCHKSPLGRSEVMLYSTSLSQVSSWQVRSYVVFYVPVTRFSLVIHSAGQKLCCILRPGHKSPLGRSEVMLYSTSLSQVSTWQIRSYVVFYVPGTIFSLVIHSTGQKLCCILRPCHKSPPGRSEVMLYSTSLSQVSTRQIRSYVVFYVPVTSLHSADQKLCCILRLCHKSPLGRSEVMLYSTSLSQDLAW